MEIIFDLDNETEANVDHVIKLLEERGCGLEEEELGLYLLYALNEGLISIANRLDKETIKGGRELILSSRKKGVSFMNHFYMRVSLNEC